MYKIKINVEITESGKEVIKNNYETECDDYKYMIDQHSKPDYDLRYKSSISISAIWDENPDRPKEK